LALQSAPGAIQFHETGAEKGDSGSERVRFVIIKRLTSTNAIEAANRAEVTAILIRAGYRVYRPEADVSGEDLVIRIPEGELRSVQMKARPLVHSKLYGGKRYAGSEMWMLFPDPTGDIPGRPWFFIKHDMLFNWYKKRHGAAPGWVQRHKEGKAEWSEKVLTDKLRKFLQPKFMLPTTAGSHKG
jgi:hypothetical protein